MKSELTRNIAVTLGLSMATLSAEALDTQSMMDRPIGYQYPDFNGDTLPAPSQRIHLILLGVKDIEKSYRFYKQLGWLKTRGSAEDFIKIDMGGYALVLFSGKSFETEIFGGVSGEKQARYNGITFAYLCKSPEEVPAMLARAHEAGGTIVKPTTRTPWGINAFFKDPDGNLFELDYEEAWQFDDEHRLIVE